MVKLTEESAVKSNAISAEITALKQPTSSAKAKTARANPSIIESENQHKNQIKFM